MSFEVFTCLAPVAIVIALAYILLLGCAYLTTLTIVGIREHWDEYVEAKARKDRDW